ncbi:hypothetical protein [Nocardia sp. CA-120079]|uniref:hypothetical protein n=1 Tax=Nocardia sp. CA-120079 TaxID=3239974 RepID=UPI003D99897C
MSDDSEDPELRAAAQFCMDTTLAYTQWIQAQDVKDGSAVATDDKLFSVMSMTELINGQLVAALDCLLLATWSLNKSGYARGHGHPALIRSALTPATCALWIMDDDPNQRRLRALQIAYAQAEAESLHVRDIAPGWRQPGETGIGAFIDSRAERRQRVVADGEQLGFSEKQIKSKPKDQDIVRRGGDRLPDGWLFDNSPGAYVISEWRLLSGRAHGFQWPIKLGSIPIANSARPDFETYDVAWSLDRALGSVRVALRVARYAMDRWAFLAGMPPCSDQMP